MDDIDNFHEQLNRHYRNNEKLFIPSDLIQSDTDTGLFMNKYLKYKIKYLQLKKQL